MNINKITTHSTSKRTSAVSDLILRETKTTRLIFRPLIIDNETNPEASVKGWFISQKKGINDDWIDIKDLTPSNLKKGEYIKLELKAEEVLKLLENANQYKAIYKEYGITYGAVDFILTDRNIRNAFEQIAKFSNIETLLNELNNLGVNDIQKLTSLVGVSQLRKVLVIWEKNKGNSDEAFWQSTFKTYSWIISQVFACPYVFMGDAYYLGGKKLDNTGGVQTDILCKNALTGNIAFVELKTPCSIIMGSKYRGNNDLDNNTVYSFSPEITGGITQVLNQRSIFKQKQDSLEASSFKVFNSKCVLVIGKIGSLTPGQKKSFDLYRNNLKDVEIIAYDELFLRIQNMEKLFIG